MKDVLSLPDSQPGMDIVFGCAETESGQIYSQAADGILGMGNNRNALHMQLAASGQVARQFSLCFGFPSGGGLLLGEVLLPPNVAARMAYTPLVQRNMQHYYNVDLQGISLNGSAVAIDPVGALGLARVSPGCMGCIAGECAGEFHGCMYASRPPCTKITTQSPPPPPTLVPRAGSFFLWLWHSA